MSDNAAHLTGRANGTRPRILVGAYLLAFLVFWVVVPLCTHEEPSSDNYEQLELATHPAWGYSKHPPLPSLVLWTFGKIFPAGLPLTYGLGGLDVAIMLTTAFLLARATLDQERAGMAVLFITCITFYGGRLHYYNHNMALLAMYAASVYCLWRAIVSGSYGWWSAVGVCWGLGLLSKYQMVIGIASSLVAIWYSRPHDSRRWFWGTLVAGVTASLLILPHAFWLVSNDFPPFHYAAKFVAADIPVFERPSNVAHFVVNQIIRLGPLCAVIGVLFRVRSTRYAEHSGERLAAQADFGGRFLALHTWGPLVIMAIMALLFGSNLEMHWGTAFLWLLPLWFLDTAPGRRLAELPLTVVLAVVATAQLVMLALSAFAGI